MRVLHLTLMKRWFDMIDANIKKEEYREIKPYWAKRLIHSDQPKESPDDHKHIHENIVFDILYGHPVDHVLKAYRAKFKSFSFIHFQNGYSRTAPKMAFDDPVISIGYGREEWGAEPGKLYFVIKWDGKK